jgi:hypothetical protein
VIIPLFLIPQGFKFVISYHCVSTTGNGEENAQTEEFDEDSDTNEVLLRHVTEEAAMDASNDFPPQTHPIARWFGCGEFLTLRPGSSDEVLVSESKIKLVLSSACIALKNSGW